jgi:hypothetical protein
MHFWGSASFEDRNNRALPRHLHVLEPFEDHNMAEPSYELQVPRLPQLLYSLAAITTSLRLGICADPLCSIQIPPELRLLDLDAGSEVF